ncbi:ATP-binding protein [Bradyrhizobium sp. CCBAU 51627]|uniref:ATP-binding protein n=1 Tax=Bradyrhizobium sp. CCBAU 51627 TaxID=1325088 RepID=UPI002306B96F|nr:sensor histidine kinase [Bradyrhizobium sp. CCBAU 51627]
MNIDYDNHGGAWSRLEFLQLLRGVVGPGSVVIVYLLDRDERQKSFLTLSYIAGEISMQSSLQRRLTLLADGDSLSFAWARAELEKIAAIRNYSRPTIYRLSDQRGCDVDDCILETNDIGIAVILKPKPGALDELSHIKLEIAWRFFSVQTTRSRHERLSQAISRMLEEVESSASKSKLCSVLAHYVRAKAILLYEQIGGAYQLVAEHHESEAPPPVNRFERSEADRLQRASLVVRSHTYSGTLTGSIQDIVGASAWMLLPCHTHAVDVLSGQDASFAQYLIFLIGKENLEYLGEDFSYTDLLIGKNLVSLLGAHLPFMGLSDKLRQLSKELDEQAISDFSLRWLSEISKRYVPSLFGVALLPGDSGADLNKYYPAPFQLGKLNRRLIDVSRDNESCIAQTSEGAQLWCLAFRIHTEYRTQQRIVFAFQEDCIQSAAAQILEMIVEYVRTAFGVIDFREYHNATQAQIRHVIRGSLSAAVSELELVAQRVRLFSSMPTKLARLLATPTMQTSIQDALLWLNEAYSLADAPRYLLETFDKNAVRWADVDPAAIVDSVLAMVHGELRRRGIRVAFDKGAVGSHFISADQEFLKIVFFNLIDNAIKYSFQDKWLRIELIYTADRFRAEIQNEGVPIKEEDREKIFHPWVRSFRQSVATRRPGTGLGLAVTRRILEAHDERAICDFTSVPIDERASVARTTFFFELRLKGKGIAA